MSRARNADMDRYCVIGNPVEHSQSPWIHARFARADRRRRCDYGKRLMPLDGFAAARARIRATDGGARLQRHRAVQVRGRRAGQPGAAPRATLAGACNIAALRRPTAGSPTTPTASAWCDDIERNAGVALAGRDVLLIGAGGAAAGVLGPLLEARPARIVVANRTAAKAAGAGRSATRALARATKDAR